MNSSQQRNSLVEEFVSVWPRLDSCIVEGNAAPHANQFLFAEDAVGAEAWKPIPQHTDAAYLEALYAKLPVRFPPLYEKPDPELPLAGSRFKVLSIACKPLWK